MASCRIDRKFNREEKEWLPDYKEGDTLIYKSNQFLDTVVVVSVSIENEYSDLLASNRNPIVAEYLFNSRDEISIRKNDSKKLIGLLKWKGTGAYIKNLTKPSKDSTYFLEKRILGKQAKSSRSKNSFFLVKSLGIIKYTNSTGQEWELYAWKRSGKNILLD